MSDPPARIRPSSMSSSSSGFSATASSGGRITASPPARWTASEYVRGDRLTSTSQAAQLALSIALQIPMTGRSTPLESLEPAELLPVGHGCLHRVDLDASAVQVVVHHVLSERLARDRRVGEQVARVVHVVRHTGLVGLVGVPLEGRLQLE